MTGMTFFIFAILLLSHTEAQLQKSGGRRGKVLSFPPIKDDTDLQELVEKFIEKALKVLVNNDPYQIQHMDFNSTSYGITSEGFIKDMFFSFLSTTKVKNIVVEKGISYINFRFDLTIDQFQIDGNYKLYMNILTMLPIYGEGGLGILLKGLGLSFSTNLMATEDRILQMTSLNIRSSLQESKVEIQNLFNNKRLGSYISSILSDMLPSTINENQKIFTIANIGLKSLLNVLMHDSVVTLDKIIDVMQHFIQ